MLFESIELALTQAEERLSQIRDRIAELEDLKHERDDLEKWRRDTIALMEEHNLRRAITAVAGSQSTLAKAAISAAITSRIAPDEDRLWKAIHAVMGMTGTPMTAAEVLSALEAQKIEVNGIHRRETVRGAMIRKPQQFERVSRGKFALVEWPEATKKLRSDELQEDEEDTPLLNGEEVPNEIKLN